MNLDFLHQADSQTRRNAVKMLAAQFLGLNLVSKLSAAPAAA